jgi:predicted GNAT family acetyltransferase
VGENRGVSEIEYVDNPARHRYEIRDGETVAGLAAYRLPDDEHVDFVHTEVKEAYNGQGLASKLVAFALADVKAKGKRIIPHCPYVAGWLKRHGDEYADITDWPA